MTATMGSCEAWSPIWCCTLDPAALAVTGTALQAATEILYHATAQQFGLCTFTLRPCRHECANAGWPGISDWWQWDAYPRPLLFDGVWSNITCGVCGDRCSCTGLSEAWLPGPIGTIIQVKLNGSIMVTGSYRVDDFRKLVRTDGGTWPVCQDMAAADTADNTWSVTLTIGQDVPVLGRYAVAELACEIARGCVGQACVLPANATQISRQGVTIDFPTFSELLANGSLGLRWSDLFVGTYNPHRLRAAPQVYDVDGPNFRRAGT